MYAAGRGGYRGTPLRAGFGAPNMGRGYSAGEDDGRVQTCYKCGGPNHFARDCHAKSVKCYACGKFEGHIVCPLLQVCDLTVFLSRGIVHMAIKPAQIRRTAHPYNQVLPSSDLIPSCFLSHLSFNLFHRSPERKTAR